MTVMWRIKKSDTLGQCAPLFYDQHSRRFEYGGSLPTRHFPSREAAQALLPALVAQTHGGLLSVEICEEV